MLGGCATVGGWGMRYDAADERDNSKCRTDFSSKSPDKIKYVDKINSNLNLNLSIL